MRKKLIKYTKFIISVALIAGLIAPSYAALSASDGSAFVTKAEFDSALADFNARLTTFEAGINSKIDSQVTSYLDRNGIWSGKEQDLEAYATDGLLTDSDHSSSLLYQMYRRKANANILLSRDKWRFDKWLLIEKVNKSGLLYFSWKLDGYKKLSDTSPDHEFAISTMNLMANRNAVEGPMEHSCWIGYGFAHTTDIKSLADLCGTTEYWSGSGSFGNTDNVVSTKVIAQPYMSAVSLFFVTRDDPIYYVWADWSIGGKPGTNSWRIWSVRANDDYHWTDCYFHTLDCKVY